MPATTTLRGSARNASIFSVDAMKARYRGGQPEGDGGLGAAQEIFGSSPM
jgi:hypothetical protein